MDKGHNHENKLERMEEVDLTDVQLKPFPEENKHLCEPPPIPILIVEQPQVLTTLPQLVRCPACSTQAVTSTTYVVGNATFLSAILCCVFCPPFCFVPFLTTPLKDVQHSCVTCKQKLGRAKLL